MSCEPPFWKNISVIFDNFSLQYIPECTHSPYNFVARLVLLSLFVGMIASIFGGLSLLLVMILFGFITAFVIIAITPRRKEKSNKKDKKNNETYYEIPYTLDKEPVGYVSPLEGFINGGAAPGSFQPMDNENVYPYSGPMLPDYTPPTSRNLFMNVLLDEMKYNPGRAEAAPVNNPTVKQTMDDYFRVQWFSDPTDVFGKNQSQRQFVTQPSTTVPNDQGSFADWLYRIPGKTCKEGGRDACLAGTDGGPVPWLNQAS